MSRTPAKIILALTLISTQYIAVSHAAPQNTTPFFTSNFNDASTLPAFSLFAPAGFTPTQDYFSFSLGGVSNIPTTEGAISLGFGLALPSDFGVSLNVDMDIKNLSKRQELSMTTGKYLSSWDASISLGIRNVTLWHDDGSQNVPSVYIAASKILVLDKQLVILNAGFGNNDFRTISDTASSTVRTKTVSPFVSAAYYPFARTSVIADYTAGIMSLGIGLVPFSSLPINVSVGVYDLTKAIPTHTGTSILASASIAYGF